MNEFEKEWDQTDSMLQERYPMETAVAELTLRNIQISLYPGLIPGYKNVKIELTHPDTGAIVIVDCCDGPAPAVSVENPKGELFDLHFPRDGGIKVF